MSWKIISGPPGIGKSRFSSSLSQIWGIKLISTDILLEQNLGMSIEQYINSQNCNDDQKWVNFREKEYETLREIESIYSKKNIVLDLGGGLLAPENIYHIQNKLSLNRVIGIRGLSQRVLNQNGLICTILPYSNLEDSLKVIGKFTKKKRKKSRPKQGENNPIFEAQEKLKLRWESYNETSDFIYYIGDNKPKKKSFDDPHILNLKQIFELKLN